MDTGLKKKTCMKLDGAGSMVCKVEAAKLQARSWETGDGKDGLIQQTMYVL